MGVGFRGLRSSGDAHGALVAAGGRACLHGAALRQTHFLREAVGTAGLRQPPPAHGSRALRAEATREGGGRIQPWGQQAVNSTGQTPPRGPPVPLRLTKQPGPPARTASEPGATSRPHPRRRGCCTPASCAGNTAQPPRATSHTPQRGFPISSIIFSSRFSSLWPWRHSWPHHQPSRRAGRAPRAQLHGGGCGCRVPGARGAGATWVLAGRRKQLDGGRGWCFHSCSGTTCPHAHLAPSPVSPREML